MTPIVSPDSILDFFGRQQAVGFGDGSFAVKPLGFNGVEPGTLHRQEAPDDSDPLAGLFDRKVVFFDPGGDCVTFVPGGIIPDKKQRSFTQLFQSFKGPGQKVNGDGTDGTTQDKSEPQILQSRYPQSITGQSLGIFVLFWKGQDLHTKAFACGVTPGVSQRLSQTTPPGLVQIA